MKFTILMFSAARVSPSFEHCRGRERQTQADSDKLIPKRSHSVCNWSWLFFNLAFIQSDIQNDSKLYVPQPVCWVSQIKPIQLEWDINSHHRHWNQKPWCHIWWTPNGLQTAVQSENELSNKIHSFKEKKSIWVENCQIWKQQSENICIF